MLRTTNKVVRKLAKKFLHKQSIRNTNNPNCLQACEEPFFLQCAYGEEEVGGKGGQKAKRRKGGNQCGCILHGRESGPLTAVFIEKADPFGQAVNIGGDERRRIGARNHSQGRGVAGWGGLGLLAARRQRRGVFARRPLISPILPLPLPPPTSRPSRLV